jgi:hypothetical protein
VLAWVTTLHGFLSSPTGGGIRHGTDLRTGIVIQPNEARLFCNLIRSYISCLMAEHALDALPEGGILCVRLRKRGDELHLTVADNGHGISPENAGAVFNPFFTTKGHRELDWDWLSPRELSIDITGAYGCAAACAVGGAARHSRYQCPVTVRLNLRLKCT